MIPKDEFKKRLNSILENVTDPGKVSEVLTALHDDYEAALNEFSEISETNKTLKAKNDSLIEANGALFVKVGMFKDPEKEEKIEQKSEEKPVLIPIEDVMENIKWGEK